MRADGRNRPRRVRVPGEVPALLRAGVRLGRQVLREPLRGLPHRLPGEETHLRGAQQGLLLQRYRLALVLIRRRCGTAALHSVGKMKCSRLFEDIGRSSTLNTVLLCFNEGE